MKYSRPHLLRFNPAPAAACMNGTGANESGCTTGDQVAQSDCTTGLTPGGRTDCLNGVLAGGDCILGQRPGGASLSICTTGTSPVDII